MDQNDTKNIDMRLKCNLTNFYLVCLMLGILLFTQMVSLIPKWNDQNTLTWLKSR